MLDTTLRTYLSTFVEGMKTMNENTYIRIYAVTGRLSSRNPNFQNMPMDLRLAYKVVESRFEGVRLLRETIHSWSLELQDFWQMIRRYIKM